MGFLPEHIESRLREHIEQRGLVLLELKRRGERGTTVLEVIIDSEGGINLDDLAELSRWTSALLDEAEDEIPGRYRLDVSSAGLDRPLEHFWQYRKNIGRFLKITFDDEKAGRTTELFRLINVEEGALVLEPGNVRGKKPVEPLVIPLDRVTRAVVEPQF